MNIEDLKITATIKKIDRRERYIRVHFTAADGTHCITDLVPTFRNYRRWEELLEIGNTLSNLSLLEPGKVDADSHPELVPAEPDPQMELF